MYDKHALIELVRQKALKFGQFTLASGKKATYYLDGKQVTLDAAGARLVAEGLLDLLAADAMPTAVGGMSIGADPITAAVVTMSGVRGVPLVGFMVRKEAKGHGTNQFVEGPVKPGDTAVIVEDVVTTGGSSLLAIERAEQFGLKVVGVLAVIDRLEGGAQAFAARLSAAQPADDPRFHHRAVGVPQKPKGKKPPQDFDAPHRRPPVLSRDEMERRIGDFHVHEKRRLDEPVPGGVVMVVVVERPPLAEAKLRREPVARVGPRADDKAVNGGDVFYPQRQPQAFGGRRHHARPNRAMTHEISHPVELPISGRSRRPRNVSPR